MRFGVAILMLGLASVSQGCTSSSSEDETRCEDHIKSQLKAPSTYRRISASSYVKSDGRLPGRIVSIEYDAENSYGVPIREQHSCRFSPVVSDPIRSDMTEYEDDLAADFENRVKVLTNGGMSDLDARVRVMDEDEAAAQVAYNSVELHQ